MGAGNFPEKFEPPAREMLSPAETMRAALRHFQEQGGLREVGEEMIGQYLGSRTLAKLHIKQAGIAPQGESEEAKQARREQLASLAQGYLATLEIVDDPHTTDFGAFLKYVGKNDEAVTPILTEHMQNPEYSLVAIDPAASLGYLIGVMTWPSSEQNT